MCVLAGSNSRHNRVAYFGRSNNLFPDKDEGQEIQFLGFVSSHRTGNVLNSFHIHSFAVFYTNKKERTICNVHSNFKSSYFIKYAGSHTSADAIDSILE